MVAVLEVMLKTYVENPAKKLSPNWIQAINAVLDIYLGSMPTNLNLKAKTIPQNLSQNSLKLDLKTILL